MSIENMPIENKSIEIGTLPSVIGRSVELAEIGIAAGGGPQAIVPAPQSVGAHTAIGLKKKNDRRPVKDGRHFRTR